MRKSVKRFLSTILALTMLCSCMVVMNVSAYADDSSTTYTYTVDHDYNATTSTAAELTLTEVNNLTTATVTIGSATVDSGACASGYTLSAKFGGKWTSSNNRCVIIPVTGACTVTVVASANSSTARVAGFYTGSSQPTSSSSFPTDLTVPVAGSGTSLSYSYTGSTSTNVYFASTDGDMRVAAVTVTYGETSGDSGETGGETGGEEEGGETGSTVTFEASLNPSALDETTYYYDTIVDNSSYFKLIYNTSSNSYSAIDSNSKSFPIANSTENFSATKRFKLGGVGTYNSRAISFKPTTDGTIYVYAVAAGGNDGERNLVLSDGTNEVSKATVASAPEEITYNVTAGNTYSLYSDKSGINIYYIGSTASLAAFDALPTADLDACTITDTNGTTYYVAGTSVSDLDNVKSCDLMYNGSSIDPIDTLYIGVEVEDVNFYAPIFGYEYVIGYVVEGSTTDVLKETYTLTLVEAAAAE